MSTHRPCKHDEGRFPENVVHACAQLQDAVAGCLVELAQTRSEIAAQTHAPSYMHYRTADCSLAGSPAAVLAYLRRVRQDTWDRAVAEVAELEAQARSLGLLAQGAALASWDVWAVRRSCLDARLRSGGMGRPRTRFAVTLDAAFETLFQVVQEMLGVYFAEQQCQPGCASTSAPCTAMHITLIGPLSRQ
jgi:Zn-dependent oligopeptidase